VDKAGNVELQNIQDIKPQDLNSDIQISKTIYTENFSGYAILAVGALTDQEGLDSHTLTADNIYKHLINRHFGIEHDPTDPLDHVKYYNPYRNHTGVDNFELDDFQKPISYKLSLQYAIEEWAFNHMSSISGPLYIILIDHGAKDTFYLSDSSETVSSKELNNWISNLEDKFKEQKDIIIIVETCYSGSFIPKLSGPGRIVITSSAYNEQSYYGPMEPGHNDDAREGGFFISNLFNELAKAKNTCTKFYDHCSENRNVDPQKLHKQTGPIF
jgi:Peptidase C13 family.